MVTSRKVTCAWKRSITFPQQAGLSCRNIFPNLPFSSKFESENAAIRKRSSARSLHFSVGAFTLIILSQKIFVRNPLIFLRKGVAPMSPEKVPRPPAAQGTTYKLGHVACDDMFVILNGWDGEENCEIFLKCGPQGSCSAAIMNALSVLFSYARRSGVPLVAIARLF